MNIVVRFPAVVVWLVHCGVDEILLLAGKHELIKRRESLPTAQISRVHDDYLPAGTTLSGRREFKFLPRGPGELHFRTELERVDRLVDFHASKLRRIANPLRVRVPPTAADTASVNEQAERTTS